MIKKKWTELVFSVDTLFLQTKVLVAFTKTRVEDGLSLAPSSILCTEYETTSGVHSEAD